MKKLTVGRFHFLCLYICKMVLLSSSSIQIFQSRALRNNTGRTYSVSKSVLSLTFLLTSELIYNDNTKVCAINFNCEFFNS